MTFTDAMMFSERHIPTLRAYADEKTGCLRAWCEWCAQWHFHGKGAGHRTAHCTSERSPYRDSGYILKIVGPWKEHPPMAARSQAVPTLAPVPETSRGLIHRLAEALSQAKQNFQRSADGQSWEMAKLYVETYPLIARALREEGRPNASPQRINRAIRMESGYAGPGGSWLQHARRIDDLFRDVFSVAGNRKLPYDHYRHLANCKLSDLRKSELRGWAEEEKVTREDLRARIRQEVDQLPNPGFKVKCDNCWYFSERIESDFDGGIHPLVVANLLYYCTAPGAVVIDPMAGGDTTYKVIQQYPYFQHVLPGVDGSGHRTIYRADLNPHARGIVQADATKHLPWTESLADFCLFDPPYYDIPAAKYATLGSSIEEWQAAMSAVAREIWRVLKPGGKVAVITDDYLRTDFQPLSLLAFQTFAVAGFTPWMVFYDIHKNYLSASPMEQARYKRHKTILNGVKVISVFLKPVTPAPEKNANRRKHA